MTKIYSVETVKIAFDKKNPPNLIVTAEGTVESGGWSQFRLSKLEYITPPADGIQEFTFEGSKPTDGATDALESGKQATARILDVVIDKYWGRAMPLTGVRVVASTNSVETLLT